jgi:hypothetical protein
MTYSRLSARARRNIADLSLLQSNAFRVTPRGLEIDAIIWMRAEILKNELARLAHIAAAKARANRRISPDQLRGPFAHGLPTMALAATNINPEIF